MILRDMCTQSSAELPKSSGPVDWEKTISLVQKDVRRYLALQIKPDTYIITHILDAFGLDDLEDSRFFTKQNINTLSNEEWIVGILELNLAMAKFSFTVLM